MDQNNNFQMVIANEASPYAANDAAIPASASVQASWVVGFRQLRISKRESQSTFWARFGVTQSSGSRFETGLGVPRPVAILVKLYVNGRLNDLDLLA